MLLGCLAAVESKLVVDGGVDADVDVENNYGDDSDTQDAVAQRYLNHVKASSTEPARRHTPSPELGNRIKRTQEHLYDTGRVKQMPNPTRVNPDRHGAGRFSMHDIEDAYEAGKLDEEYAELDKRHIHRTKEEIEDAQDKFDEEMGFEVRRGVGHNENWHEHWDPKEARRSGKHAQQEMKKLQRQRYASKEDIENNPQFQRQRSKYGNQDDEEDTQSVQVGSGGDLEDEQPHPPPRHIRNHRQPAKSPPVSGDKRPDL